MMRSIERDMTTGTDVSDSNALLPQKVTQLIGFAVELRIGQLLPLAGQRHPLRMPRGVRFKDLVDRLRLGYAAPVALNRFSNQVQLSFTEHRHVAHAVDRGVREPFEQNREAPHEALDRVVIEEVFGVVEATDQSIPPFLE